MAHGQDLINKTWVNPVLETRAIKNEASESSRHWKMLMSLSRKGYICLARPWPRQTLSSQHPILQLTLPWWNNSCGRGQASFQNYCPPEDQNRNEGPYRFGSFQTKCNSSSKSREAWRPTVRIQPSTCVEPTRTELNGVKFFAAAANQAHGPVPQLVSTVEERKQIRAPNLQLPTRSSSSLLKWYQKKKILISAAQY